MGRRKKKEGYMRKQTKLLLSLLLGLGILTTLVSITNNQNEQSQQTTPVSQEIPTRKVIIVNHQGEAIGTATLIEESKGVRIQINVSKLSPGKHGFHVHEKAFTGVAFDQSAGHFNPEGKSHGKENAEGLHAGDLPNLVVKENGSADVSLLIPKVTLKRDDPFSILGRSIIIHAKEDDLHSDPAGNAGKRIAGGVIPQ
jgi:Cu-Zn family superoxide dismutase